MTEREGGAGGGSTGDPAAPEGGRAGAGGRRLFRRIGRGAGAVLGLLLLGLAAGLLFLTQTRAGRDAVAGWIEARIEVAIAGDVELGPIVGGNLLTRAILERFAIVEPGGEVFVSLEGVRLSYAPMALLRGDFVFRDITAERGRLQLLQADDGSWNFDRLFGDAGAEPAGTDPAAGDGPEDAAEAEPEEPPEEEPGETRLSLHDLRVASGVIALRMPWAAGLEGAAYDSAVAEGLRGDALWRVEPAPDGEGYVQVARLDSLRGRFPLLRLAHPRLPMEVRMDRLAGVLEAVGQPLRVRRFDGSIVFRDTVRLAMEEVRLPESRFSGEGWMLFSDPMAYRFELDGDPIGFADLQWLPVPLPETGGGPMELVVATRGEAVAVEAAEGRVRVDDTALEGSFTLLLEETPRFEAFDVRLRPLRLALLDRLLGRETRIDGYVEGRLQGSGRLDALRMEGSGVLNPLESGEAGSGSRVSVRGTAGVVEPYAARELEIGVEAFHPRWLRLAGLKPKMEGELEGSLVLDGSPAGRMGFTADLRHRAPDHAASRVSGGGTVELGDRPAVDVRLTADPLSLALLEPYFPDLRLVGAVRGPISARGPPADLRAEADLETPRGRLRFEGRFDLEAEEKTYDARVEARDIDLRQWAEKLPGTDLAVGGRVQGRGTDPATLEARFDLEILPSVFAEARVDTSLLRFRVSEGLATVDTFAVRTDVGEARGRGGFGLAERLSGTLVLDLTVPDLASWNRWLVPGRFGGGPPERPDDLFADFPGDAPAGQEAAPAPAEAVAVDTLSGSLTARGVVFGNLDAFSFGGRLAAREAGYGPHSADSLVARLDVTNPSELDSLVMNATAWGLRVFGQAADSVSARMERRGPGQADVRLFAVRDTAFLFDTEGEARWDEEGTRLEFRRLRLRVGDQDLSLAGPASLAYGEAGLAARDFALRGSGGGLLSARGEVPAEGPASFDLEFRDLRLGELLEPRAETPRLAGALGGRLAIRGTARSPRMEGSIRIDGPGLRGVRFPLLEGEWEYADRRLRGELDLRDEDEAILLRAAGEARVDLAFREARTPRLADDAFDFRIRADSLPARVLELMSESLREVEGFVRGEVRVTGDPDRLRVDGEARLAGGAARVPDLGVRFVDVAGRVRFRGSEARVDSLGLRSARGGSAWMRGTVGLAEIGDPTFDLRISARRLAAIDRRAMSLLAGGEVTLGGSYREPRLTGEARIFNGDLRQEEFLRTQQIVDLTDPEVFALIDTTVVAERRLLERVQNPFMRNLRLDVSLDVGPDLWLRSAVLNVELVGEDLEVRMDRAQESLVAFGTVRLVRGTYVFDRIFPYRQQLRIVGGTIEFVGEPGLNPSLAIQAEYRTRTDEGPVVIRAEIGGTMRQTEITLASEPPMAESDQLCFLALGSPCAAAADAASAQRIARESVLGTLGTGLSSALVGEVGLDYLAVRSGRTPALDAERGFFSRGLFSNTEIEVGKYLGSDLFVTVTQPLGNRYPGWSIEWRFTRNWTLEARAENRFATRVGLSTSNLEFDQALGLFLFREWSF